MLLICYWSLAVAFGMCAGEGRRRWDKEKAANGSMDMSDNDLSPHLYNDIQLKSIKWSDILATVGQGTVISDRRLTGRKPWCRSQNFRLELRSAGCTSRHVLTKFCYGQCSSFYIPRHGSLFQSCPVCRPSKGTWTSPLLLCKDGVAKRSQPVYRVKKCKCLELK